MARNRLHHLGPGLSTTLLSLPAGEPTILALRDGRVLGTFALTLRAGRVHHIHGILDPAKLTDLDLILDPSPEPKRRRWSDGSRLRRGR